MAGLEVLAFCRVVWFNKFTPSFLVTLCFSGTIKARVMKLGSCLHVIEGS